jgi:hypothetical protein
MTARPHHLAVLAGFSLLLLRGSSCTTIARPYPPPSATELTASVRARGLRVRSLRAETRMSLRSSEGKIKATVRLMAERGGRLRCDAVSPFDTPLMTLVVSGPRFGFVDAQKNRHYHGPASPCNISRLLQVALSPDDIVTVLGGSTPLIPFKHAEVSWDAREGVEVLSLRGDGFSQTLRLDGRGRSWNLLRSEVTDGKGAIVLKIESSGYHDVGGLAVPRDLRISQPKQGADLAVSFKRQELNLTLPGEAFELPEAGGLPSQFVDCATVVKP